MEERYQLMESDCLLGEFLADLLADLEEATEETMDKAIWLVETFSAKLQLSPYFHQYFQLLLGNTHILQSSLTQIP